MSEQQSSFRQRNKEGHHLKQEEKNSQTNGSGSKHSLIQVTASNSVKTADRGLVEGIAWGTGRPILNAEAAIIAMVSTSCSARWHLSPRILCEDCLYGIFSVHSVHLSYFIVTLLLENKNITGVLNV